LPTIVESEEEAGAVSSPILHEAIPADATDDSEELQQYVAYISPPSSRDPVYLAATPSLEKFCADADRPAQLPIFLPPPGLSLPVDEHDKERKGHASSADGSTTCGSSDGEPDSATDEFTTLVFRNCPNDLSRDSFCATLDQHGLAGLYDFIYMPADLIRHSNLGYCFANFVSHEAALKAWDVMDGFENWTRKNHKVCCVQWCSSLQGLEGHITLYRNSTMMHEAVEDRFKPVLLRDGVRVPFPAPTKKIKAPRMKFGKPKKTC